MPRSKYPSPYDPSLESVTELAENLLKSQSETIGVSDDEPSSQRNISGSQILKDPRLHLGLSSLDTLLNGYSILRASQINRRITQYNINAVREEARQLRAHGKLKANRSQAKGEEVISSQKAAYASDGVSIRGSSAGSVTKGSQIISQLNALDIGDQARRKALGLEMRASSDLLKEDLRGISLKRDLAIGAFRKQLQSYIDYKFPKGRKPITSMRRELGDYGS